MKLKLTALGIPTLPEGEFWDDGGPARLVVRKRRKTWQYRFRAGGKSIRHRIGHWPQLGLSDARRLAREAAGRIEAGSPPATATPHPRDSDALSLGALLDKYERVRLREARRTKTLPRLLKAVRKDLRPFLSIPARSFTKADGRAVRDALISRGSPVQANRVISGISAFLDWAASEDHVESNPMRFVRKTPEKARDRVFSSAEIRRLWQACEASRGRGVAEAYGRLIRFLLLTGQRRGEAASMKFADVLGDVWKQSDNKAGRPHSLKLPAAALALLRPAGTSFGQNEVKPTDLCFAGPDGKPIVGFSEAARKLAKESGIDGFRPHDLRRTFASGLQGLGVWPDTIELCLNHAALAGVSAIANVYLKHEQEVEKAAALRLWAAEVERIVGAPAVVQLRA